MCDCRSRISRLILALGLPFLFGSCRGEPGTEILWDTCGVPHIFAQRAQDLFRAHGWAQMEAHGDLILRLYGQARGRAAEYWGEEYLESDIRARTHGIPERGQAWYLTQDSEMYDYLQAFVRGMNAYAREHPARIDADVQPVLPVEPADVLAHLLRSIHHTFISGTGTVPRHLRESLQEETLAGAVGGSNA